MTAHLSPTAWMHNVQSLMTKWHQIGSKNNTANRQNQMDFIEV